MFRRAHLIIYILIAQAVSAQSWCPPGAEWHFSVGGYLFDGYMHRTYTGDTLIEGRVAQRLSDNGYVLSTFSGSPIYFARSNEHFTTVDDDVLLLRRGIEWDTLVRFDAVPGERWYPRGGIGACGDHPSGMVQVVDTTTIYVDGIALRSSVLAAVGEGGVLLDEEPGHRYLDRIGLLGGFIFDTWCLFDGGYEILRCYSDDEITFRAPGWTEACDIGLSVITRTLDLPTIFPNPGTDRFTLSGISPGSRIELFDGLGRRVFTGQALGEPFHFDARGLTPGLYQVRIGNGEQVMSWIKE